MITHYMHGDTAACAERIRPPWLSADPELTSCGNCTRTDAWKNSLPVPGTADPADVPVLLEWIKRLAAA